MQPRHLFLIDGAAGAGKSDLISFVERQLSDKRTCVLRKFTTREHRESERKAGKPLDLEFVSDAEFDRRIGEAECYAYFYPAGPDQARYGFRRTDLDNRLESCDNVFIIVRNAPIIKEIQEDYPTVDVVPVFVYTQPEHIRSRLEKDEYPEDEIQLRLSRSDEAMEDYFHHPLLYRHVLINNSSREVYQNQLREIFERHNSPHEGTGLLRISAIEHYHLPRMIHQHKRSMLAKLKKHPFGENILLMMRFDRDANELFDVIRTAVNASGRFRCVRADMPEWAITRDEVSNPYAVLFCCCRGIALFDKEPTGDDSLTNVAIEAAVMRTLGKQCLILKKRGVRSLPFNLEGLMTTEYSRDSEVVRLVEDWLEALAFGSEENTGHGL